jgi:quinol monooxygenase YgiN
MRASRRTFIAGIPVLATATRLDRAAAAASQPSLPERSRMYGLIGKITSVPGQRDALIDILLEGTTAMPGCLSYVVSRDPQDPDGIWVTEVWESAGHHKASLSLPAVQEAIGKAKPLIAGFSHRTEVEPVGGVGLPPL